LFSAGGDRRQDPTNLVAEHGRPVERVAALETKNNMKTKQQRMLYPLEESTPLAQRALWAIMDHKRM